MKLEEAVTQDLAFATQMMNEYGSLDHMVIGYKEDGGRIGAILRCENSQQKDIAAMVLRLVFALEDVECYTHMSEAWMATAPNPDEIKNIVPSEDPNRVEIVTINGVSTLGNITKIFKIVRNSDEKFEKLELMDEYNNLQIAGRFAELLESDGVPRPMVKSAARRILDQAGIPSFIEIYRFETATDSATVH